MNANMDATTSSSQDERIMAALSHVSALFPFMGIIVPVIIWVTQKEKSRYVAFQALQALAYQLTMILILFVGMACYMCSFFSMFLGIPLTAGTSSGPSQTMPPLFAVTFAVPFLIFGTMFIGQIAFIVYGLIGAVMTLQGKAFRYIVVGAQLERYLQRK
jgi:uncharacterized Tic20 family protein